MIDKEFSPDKFINREAERQLFNNLYKFQDARLLTICDSGGRGKSSLLKQLRYECGWQHEPPTLAGLVPLDQLSEVTRFALVTEIKRELTNFADEFSLKARFPRFDRLNDARSAGDFTPFRALIAQKPYDAEANYQAAAGSAEGWNDYKEDVARRECVNAFFEDIKQISSTQPVIVFLDSWERAEAGLAEWIVNRIVRPLCFDVENRPQKFGLVLAGRALPNFKQRIGDEARYNRLVKSIESLGLWEENHVKAFLQAYGYEDISQHDGSVKYICAWLKEGRSLIAALQLATAMRAG